MKWTALFFVTLIGLYATAPDEAPDDPLVAQACAGDPSCIRRHNTARRAVLGSQNEVTDTRITWTQRCPMLTWVTFQACYDAGRK